MDLIIIDCQNDFVDGSLAAPNGPEVVKRIKDFLDNSEEEIRTFYSADFHPANHMSFAEQGGPWPPHCVADTFGSAIHELLKESKNPPTEDNLFLKGRDENAEEYSAFEAKNVNEKALKEEISDEVYIVGIASEYCVRETAIAFKEIGKKVIVLKDLLGYINEEDHVKNLKDLEEKGIEVR